MAKKRTFLKAAVGVTAAAVAGKAAYDKYKVVKEKFDQEEEESVCEEVKKYNAVAASKAVEVEDEVFNGCEVKAIASKVILDLSYAVIEKDVYINFKSDFSSVLIVLPDGVNAACDIEKVLSGINNEVENTEENANTVYIIGKATCSSIEVLPFSAFTDAENDEDDFIDEDDIAEGRESDSQENVVMEEVKMEEK